MSTTYTSQRALLAVLALGCAACGHFKLSLSACPVSHVPATTLHARIRYLGAGGYLVDVQGTKILLGPEYTNPSLVEVGFNHHIRSDGPLIDNFLPKEAEDAVAILVGHSHYDHLLDVPYIALERAKGATIYGSSTTRNLLDSILPRLHASGRDVVALDHLVGTWVEHSPRFRILPIASSHSDQVTVVLPFGLARWPFHLFRGAQETPLAALPRTASEWVEGPVFAYLVDFLDAGGRPIFRVYYQDSGADPPLGLVPEWALSDGKRVDVALICIGGALEQIVRHPETIIENTRPRYAILGHWEDFFVSQRAYCSAQKQKLRRVEALPVASFQWRQLWGDTYTEHAKHRADEALRKVGGAKSFLPCPTASIFELPFDGTGAHLKETYAQNVCRSRD